MSALSGKGIVLASNSASRKAMLSAAGVVFDAQPANVDERALEAEMDGADPAEIAQALAAAKAAAVNSDRIVLERFPCGSGWPPLQQAAIAPTGGRAFALLLRQGDDVAQCGGNGEGWADRLDGL